jgi:hypothetical protein
MRRFPEVVLGFLLGFATLLIIFLLSSDIAAHYEVCEATKESAKNCASYNVLSYALHKIGTALDSYNGVITAIATAFIAWFTLSLRQSTDRLWDAGERQIKLLADSSVAQSHDMKQSIAAAKEANNVAERAMIAGQRPWIHVDVSLDGGMVFDDQGNATIPLLFILKNIGRSPATSVRVNTYFFLESPHHSQPLVQYRKFCEIVRDPKYDMMSHTLFPDEKPRQIRLFVSIGSSQFNEHRKSWEQVTGYEWRHFAPHLIGCVSYAIPFDDRQHQTGFMAQLKRRLIGQREPLQWGMFNLDERTVPNTEMRLFYSPFGSPHID